MLGCFLGMGLLLLVRNTSEKEQKVMYTETLSRPVFCEGYFYVYFVYAINKSKHFQDCLILIDHCTFLENVAQLVLFAFFKYSGMCISIF